MNRAFSGAVSERYKTWGVAPGLNDEKAPVALDVHHISFRALRLVLMDESNGRTRG